MAEGGTLYPILTRLEHEGLLTSTWREGENGPGRKFFEATPAGLAALHERTDSWLTFTGRASALLTTRGPTKIDPDG
jgi:PadR family transcriptional regulator PadR